jgi:hypothetical protein
MYKLITFLLLTVLSPASYANTPPPKEPLGGQLQKSTLKSKPTTGFVMGSFRVQFEKTILDDVRQAATTGEISNQGEAGTSIYWLCYTNLNSNKAERIWIVSDGEMGGSEHYITSISAQLLPSGKATKDCPVLPKTLKPLSLNHNFWLNSSDSDLHKMFGKPSYRSRNWRSYNYQGKVQGNCEGGFDLLNWLEVRIVKGRASSLHVGQVTSC